ncbi:tyrosine-type recombinase/integrase [Nocardia abscessus]|uniref:tyrosine-type recombinase/integrase n=1 Tax=Nocardia abscessus TaxID=120957 RepID=UPI002B4B1988|nr:tyrosine-type recombinase/integrase [Nocardia abscessus]
MADLSDARLRERVLWHLLYESSARAEEVLMLDVPDLDTANRCAVVTRKGGARNVIAWQTGTARLLPRMLVGRKSGPLFLTDRKGPLVARTTSALRRGGRGCPTAAPLSCSRLTPPAMVRSLAKYARVSDEGLRRYQADSDPAARSCRGDDPGMRSAPGLRLCVDRGGLR